MGPDLRLLPAAVAGWAAAWWATGARSPWVLATVLLAAAATVVAVVRGVRGGRAAWATAGLALAVATAVLAVSGWRLAEREAGPLPAWAADRATAEVSGRVAADPRRIDPGPGGAERWVVRLSSPAVAARGGTTRAAGPVLVLGGPRWGDAVAGTSVRVRGRLLPPQHRADVAVAALVADGPPVVTSPGAWPWRLAERLRTGLRAACAGLPPDAAGLLPALVVGDTSRLSAELEADLLTAGMTHLTAVSGGNVSVIAAAAALALSGLGADRRVRVVGTGVAVAGFVVLARPEPSVLRAAVMGVVGLVGVLLARPGAGVPALAGAAIGLLALDPWLARSYGFVLSVLATAGLLLLVPVWLSRSRLPRPVVLLVAVPLAAQAVTAPVVILLQPTVSLVAVPANALAAPAVAPATIAGVVAAAMSPAWPGGARVVAIAGGAATSWIAAVAHTASGVPGGSVPWPPGLLGAGLLAALTAVALAASVLPAGTRRRLLGRAGSHWWAVVGRVARPRGSPSLRGVPRPGALGIGLVVAAVVAGWALGPRLPRPGGESRRPWAVVMCDVGQGDATLLRSGPDRAVLVDAGPDPGLVDGCLRRWHVRSLDLVVLTHQHADHVGGLAGALRGRGRPPLLVSPCTEPDDQQRAVRELAARTGTPLTVGAAGAAGRAGGVTWRLVWPDPGATCSPGAEGDEINDDSLVIDAEVAGLRVVALGDVETEAQRRLADRLPEGTVDVVKVAHHGSAKQDPALYARIRPRLGLIGVGRANDYGHPAPSTLAMLRSTGIRALRTDLGGDLAVFGPSTRLAVSARGSP